MFLFSEFRLESAGLIESRHGSGTFVCDRNLVKVAAAVSRFGLTAQTASAAREMMEARLVLETGSAWGLALRLGQDQGSAAALTRCFLQLEASLGDIAAFGLADVAFHHALVELSGNPFITAIHTALLPALNEYMARTYVTVDQLPIAQEEHRAIYRALLAGDAAAATKALSLHLRRSITEAMALAAELWPEVSRATKGRIELQQSLSPKTRKIKEASQQKRQSQVQVIPAKPKGKSK